MEGQAKGAGRRGGQAGDVGRRGRQAGHDEGRCGQVWVGMGVGEGRASREYGERVGSTDMCLGRVTGG